MELNLKDAEEITYESQKQVAIKIMRTNLPEYVVNCFVAAGFDTLEVIADMDTSGEPGNSLQLIEDFINNEHPGDTKFTHGTTAASTFKFPPGHRQIKYCKVCAANKAAGGRNEKIASKKGKWGVLIVLCQKDGKQLVSTQKRWPLTTALVQVAQKSLNKAA